MNFWLRTLEQFDPILAWYANPALIWCVWRLASRKELSKKALIAVAAVATMGVMLAYSGLQPTHIEYGDDHGVNGQSYPLTGAYVWLASFVPILIATWIELLRHFFFAGAIAPAADEPSPTPAASLREEGVLTIKQDTAGVILLLIVMATLVALAFFLWETVG